MADAEFLFGRRRRSAPSVVRNLVQTQVVTNVEKFNMDFKAAGVIGIPVRPSFVNRQFIRQYRGGFAGHWFGQGGRMCLLPSMIWVAMKPSVTLRLAETEYRQIQNNWNAGRSVGLAAGSVFFRNNAFRQLAESNSELLSDSFNPEVLSYMRETGDLEDTAVFRELSASDEETLDSAQFRELSDTEDVAQFIIKAFEDDEAFDDTEVQEDMLASQGEDSLESMSSSDFLFRRRRRSPPPPRPPPPPPPPPREKVYEASFSSNSNLPQIIAYTSDIL